VLSQVSTRVSQPLKSLHDILVALVPKTDGSRASLLQELPYFYGFVTDALFDSKLNWAKSVDKSVYGGVVSPYDMSSFDLESPVADWAFGKDLVFAAAAVSSPAVISNQGGVKQQKLFSRLSLDGSLSSPSSLTKDNPGVLPC